MRKPPEDLLMDFINAMEQGLNSRQMSNLFDRNERTIRHWKAWYREEYGDPSVSAVPESPEPDYREIAPALEGDFMVCGDIEIPRHHAGAIRLLLKFQKHYGLSQLVLNGDTFAGDAFSKWAVETSLQQVSLRKELDIGRQMFDALLTAFERVTMISGNHDKRLARHFFGDWTYGDFLKMIAPDVEFYEHAYALATSGGEEWLICHPGNYSKVPLSVAREIAEVKQKNVLAAHTHHLGMCKDKSGRWWCVDGGCMADPARAAYKSMNITRHPEWNPGFVMLLNGRPYLVDVNTCDEQFWLT